MQLSSPAVPVWSSCSGPALPGERPGPGPRAGGASLRPPSAGLCSLPANRGLNQWLGPECAQGLGYLVDCDFVNFVQISLCWIVWGCNRHCMDFFSMFVCYCCSCWERGLFSSVKYYGVLLLDGHRFLHCRVEHASCSVSASFVVGCGRW